MLRGRACTAVRCVSCIQAYIVTQLTCVNVQVGISRIPGSQATRLVNQTHAIPGDEDHYVVQLFVFHQLHCLVGVMIIISFVHVVLYLNIRI